jgi:FSR family fosmidomycin resistance protein-like MFS transporter
VSRPLVPDPADAAAAIPAEPESGEFQTGRVATIAAGHASHDTFTAFLPLLLPQFIEKLVLSKAAAGGLSAFLELPGLLQPVIGHMADRTTLRWAVVLAPGVSATLMSLLGWAPTYAVLALMLMLTGVSVAAFHAVAPVALARLSGSQLGKGMGFWMVGGELGRTLGPMVTAGALTFLSLKSMAVLAIVGMSCSVALHFRLRNVTLRTHGDGKQVPWRIALLGMRRLMIILSGLMALHSMMMVSVTLFLPLYLTEGGSSLWLAGAALSIVQGSGVAGALAGGWLSDHLGRRNVLLFSHLAAPAALFLFLAVDGWMRIAVLPLIGATLLTILPVLMAMVQEEFPESRALANGVFLSLCFTIRSAAAIVFGAFGDAFGLNTAMVVGGIAMIISLPLVWLLPRRRK